MSDSGKASKKVLAHITHICRLSANLIFIFFLVGSTLSILGYSTDNLGTWRINFSNQLMDRSHLPLIGVALYSLSLMSSEERKYQPSVYWKQLTIISSLGVLLYTGCLLDNSERAYSITKRNLPKMNLDGYLDKIQKSVDHIKSIEEAKVIFDTVSMQSGNQTNIDKNDNLESIKLKIKELKETLLINGFQQQEKEFIAVNRRNKLQAIRFVIYSVIFIIFYLKLALFFNRLKMSS